jgi:hypothetical protein
MDKMLVLSVVLVSCDFVGRCQRSNKAVILILAAVSTSCLSKCDSPVSHNTE